MKFSIGDIVRIKASKYDVMKGVGREDLVEMNVTITDVQERWVRRIVGQKSGRNVAKIR